MFTLVWATALARACAATPRSAVAPCADLLLLATGGAGQVLQDEGFNEEHFWSNVKLVLLTAASAVALIAQFYPMPFPESRTLLATCCTLCVVQYMCGGRAASWPRLPVWPLTLLRSRVTVVIAAGERAVCACELSLLAVLGTLCST